MRGFFHFVLLLLCLLLTACQTLVTGGKVLATPVAAVRDVVDAPLVIIASDGMALDSRLRAEGSDSFSTGYSLVSGLTVYPVALLVGCVDYVICRSVVPEWPTGISPWRGLWDAGPTLDETSTTLASRVEGGRHYFGRRDPTRGELRSVAFVPVRRLLFPNIRALWAPESLEADLEETTPLDPLTGADRLALILLAVAFFAALGGLLAAAGLPPAVIQVILTMFHGPV